MSCGKDEGKCERTNKKVICLPDRNQEGKHCKQSKLVCLPSTKLDDFKKVYSQDAVTVHQQSLLLVVQEGCHDKKADHVQANVHFKKGRIDGGKAQLLIKKPDIHVQPQKVNVKFIEGPKGTCDDTVIDIHIDAPQFTVSQTKYDVKFEKGCNVVTAPVPIVCVKRVPYCKPKTGKAKTGKTGKGPQVNLTYNDSKSRK